MLPVIARNLLESIELLSASAKNFTHKCLEGLEADLKQCLEYAQNSLSICTSLVPHIGYDRAAQVSKLATQENLSVREAAKKMGLLSSEELDKVLDLFAMIRPGL
jgi:fumarate hydratase class II